MRPYLLSILFILLFSCGSDTDRIREYFAYLNDPKNQLIKKNESNFYEYTVSYSPAEAMALISSENKSISIAYIRELKKEYENMIYFNLEIKKKQATKDNLSTQHLAFGFQNSISLIDIDTIPCSMFHFVNSGNINGIYRFQLGFDAALVKKDSDLKIYIRDFGEDANIVFNYLHEDIKNIKDL